MPPTLRSAATLRAYRSLRVLAIALAGHVGAVSGCASKPTPVAYARPYPTGMVQRETLDIQVFRSTHHLEFTNTTARVFGPSTIWLNAWFSRPIDGLAVGQTLRLPLKEFRDEYQAPIRAGGFFATEPPEKVVLAQIETMDAEGKPIVLGLVVVSGPDE